MDNDVKERIKTTVTSNDQIKYTGLNITDYEILEHE